MILCPLCASSSPSVSMLLAHIRLVHACDPGFHVQCGLQGYQRTFHNFYTYRNHVYSIHGWDSITLEATDESTDVFDDINHAEIDQVISNEAALQEDRMSIAGIYALTYCTLKEQLYFTGEESVIRRSADNSRIVALWLLKLKEVHGIPQSVMRTITEEVKTIFDSIVENIRCQIGTIMDNTENIAEARLLMCQHLSSASNGLFRGLETPAQQLKYFQDNFDLVVSS